MLSSAYKFSLFIVLSILLFGTTESINIKNAFNKKRNGAATTTEEPTISEEDAIANAKKLVSDLNDAATGTGKFYSVYVYYFKIVWWCMSTHLILTTYCFIYTVTATEPGYEKAPVTCNEIMAKSLVVANEEKAAITAEKDAGKK